MKSVGLPDYVNTGITPTVDKCTRGDKIMDALYSTGV